MGPNQRFRMLCNKLGWGDASGALWFVGVEESGHWNADDGATIDRDYADGQLFHRDDPPTDSAGQAAGPRSAISKKEAWIASPLMKTQVEFDVLRQTLWRSGRKVAHLNLRPLANQGTDTLFPVWYADLFGFDPNHTAEYEEYLREYRYPLFQQARDTYHPQAIVCLGKAFSPQFAQAFKLKETDADVSDPDFAAFPESRVIITSHFAWKANLTEEVAARIAATLARWGVSLP